MRAIKCQGSGSVPAPSEWQQRGGLEYDGCTCKSGGCTVPETQFHGAGGREASHGSGHGGSDMQAVTVKEAR